MAKQISLTKGQYSIVDDEDCDFLSKWNWVTHSNGYACRHENKKTFMMHREILKRHRIVVGRDIDHVNGSKLDNRKKNLRSGTRTQNNGNRKKQKNNRGKYKGVCPVMGSSTYRATITCNKKTVHIGCFKNPEDAALAYNKMAKKLFGEFALLNEVV